MFPQSAILCGCIRLKRHNDGQTILIKSQTGRSNHVSAKKRTKNPLGRTFESGAQYWGIGEEEHAWTHETAFYWVRPYHDTYHLWLAESQKEAFPIIKYFFSEDARDWHWDLLFAKQMLHHWSTAPPIPLPSLTEWPQRNCFTSVRGENGMVPCFPTQKASLNSFRVRKRSRGKDLPPTPQSPDSKTPSLLFELKGDAGRSNIVLQCHVLFGP